jgi:hypothetical protein
MRALLDKPEKFMTTEGTPVKVRHLSPGLPGVSVVSLCKLHPVPVAAGTTTGIRPMLFHVIGVVPDIESVTAS